MGIALAETAAKLGADVDYISGPTSLPDPLGCKTTHVVTAEDMKKAVLDRYEDQDIVIMSAAVEDIKPKTSASGKLKKDKMPERLDLERTDDILKELGKRKNKQILVGFSVEVQDEIENSIDKMKKKNLDWIVVNNPGQKGAAFAGDTNQVIIIDKTHKSTALPMLSKAKTAEAIWETITNTKD